MVAAIVNFYYFRTYGNKIDVFIFGLKDDDTLAILSIYVAGLPACDRHYMRFDFWNLLLLSL
ncbi:hypothetical protein [uncultured Helicobacter sp.]|uniref:hypothetical protein n=1 Tax=uncultured Helicobacter sp. TaxID=175537 RepID=UPI002604A132|nr:hypothetical protein [uncultured Helicobacter sp.]